MIDLIIAAIEIEGKTKDFPKDIFPKQAAVGDVVEINMYKVKILKGETEKIVNK